MRVQFHVGVGAIFLAAICALAPRAAFAQAEPAPPDFVPAGRNEPIGDPVQLHESSKLTPRFFLSLSPRLALGLGDMPTPLSRAGFGGGMQFSAALLSLGPLRAGLAFSFSYDRFQHEKIAVTSPDTTQFVSDSSFAFSVYLDALFGRVRPWAAVGGGFSISQYENPSQDANTQSVSNVAAVGLIRAALGISILVKNSVEIGGHGEVIALFSDATDGTPPIHTFSPGLAAFSLDLGFRF